MPRFARYAVYYTPEPGPLADFGAAWLGWDIATGAEVAHPDLPGLPRPVAELTATPRKYGFHGTVKPPFRLAEGHDAEGLELAAQHLATRLEPVTLDGGESRSFLEDGDTLTLHGAARGDGYQIGFGPCAGQVRPARPL